MMMTTITDKANSNTELVLGETNLNDELDQSKIRINAVHCLNDCLNLQWKNMLQLERTAS